MGTMTSSDSGDQPTGDRTAVYDGMYAIVQALFVLNPDERRDCVSMAKQFYCFDCGYPTPPEGWTCQCAPKGAK